jgi:hypothetical protein
MSLPAGRGQQRVRSWGLARNREGIGKLVSACGIGGLFLSSPPQGHVIRHYHRHQPLRQPATKCGASVGRGRDRVNQPKDIGLVKARGVEQDRQAVGDHRRPSMPPRRQDADDTPPDSPQDARLTRPTPLLLSPSDRPHKGDAALGPKPNKCVIRGNKHCWTRPDERE